MKKLLLSILTIMCVFFVCSCDKYVIETYNNQVSKKEFLEALDNKLDDSIVYTYDEGDFYFYYEENYCGGPTNATQSEYYYHIYKCKSEFDYDWEAVRITKYDERNTYSTYETQEIIFMQDDKYYTCYGDNKPSEIDKKEYRELYKKYLREPKHIFTSIPNIFIKDEDSYYIDEYTYYIDENIFTAVLLPEKREQLNPTETIIQIIFNDDSIILIFSSDSGDAVCIYELAIKKVKIKKPRI